ncbi:hypothetical protein [Cellulosimicrobium sp. I38E]|uniref:hypothetical protein n=1 Tax=Cellulosimicrobium sp. I38E TaxID=1393139 RepID=UPI0007B23F49|nr:hypothetical protein [Cellulosimicrobium sp. I38E]KZM76630.1 hypothetical protein A0J59_20150 [Cellulosimicrobium sp. I38E]
MIFSPRTLTIGTTTYNLDVAGRDTLPTAYTPATVQWSAPTGLDNPDPSTFSIDVTVPPGHARPQINDPVTLFVDVWPASGDVVFYGAVDTLRRTVREFRNADGSTFEVEVLRVTAIDWLGVLARRRLGDEPWPLESWAARALRIAELTADLPWASLPTDPTAQPQVAPRDIDATSALDILRDTIAGAGKIVTSSRAGLTIEDRPTWYPNLIAIHPNLIPNPSFEVNTAGWSTGGDAAATRTTSFPQMWEALGGRDGASILQVTAGGTTTYMEAISSSVPVEPGTWVAATALVASDSYANLPASPDRGVTLEIVWDTFDYTATAPVNPAFYPGARLTVTAQAPEDATSFFVRVVGYSGSSSVVLPAGRRLWLDAVVAATAGTEAVALERLAKTGVNSSSEVVRGGGAPFNVDARFVYDQDRVLDFDLIVNRASVGYKVPPDDPEGDWSDSSVVFRDEASILAYGETEWTIRSDAVDPAPMADVARWAVTTASQPRWRLDGALEFDLNQDRLIGNAPDFVYVTSTDYRHGMVAYIANAPEPDLSAVRIIGGTLTIGSDGAESLVLTPENFDFAAPRGLIFGDAAAWNWLFHESEPLTFSDAQTALYLIRETS